MYELVTKKSSHGLQFLFLISLLILSGCAKSYNVAAPDFTPKSSPVLQKSASSRYLPQDDGLPLSKQEQLAMASTGVLDNRVNAEDLQDTVLHFKSFVRKNRATVEQSIKRGQFYMPYIQQVLQQEGLPVELSYLAFIESGYNTQARSRSGAVGMWQFMPSTGKQYGLPKDAWIDLRRDPYESTKAAAAYLSRLYKMFQDWPLAITAYNAGEGRVSRGLAATGANNFFELRRRNNNILDEKDRLSGEAQQYLPKLLAVCKIMRNLEPLGFERPNYSLAVPMTEYQVKPNTDLQAMSQYLGLPWAEFQKHNPAYETKTSHQNRTTSVYVPRHLAPKAQAFLAKPVYATTQMAAKTSKNSSKAVAMNQAKSHYTSSSNYGGSSASSNSSKSSSANNSKQNKIKVINYTVQIGESVWAIARKFQVAPLEILALNNFTRETPLKPGDMIKVAVQ